MILVITRHVDGEILNERLTLRYKELRFLLDKINSTHEESFGNEIFQRVLYFGARFQKKSRNFTFVKM